MKKLKLTLALLSLIVILPFFSASALIIKQIEWQGTVCDYIAGEVVVGMKLDASASVLDSLVAQINGQKIDSIPDSKTYLIGFHPDTSITTVINHFNSSSSVRFAEPNLVGYPAAEQYQDSLWGFYNYGQSVDTLVGTPDADADILEARAIEKGDTTVMISIIDQGIAMDSVTLQLIHPDLNDESRIKLDTLLDFRTRIELRDRSLTGHGTAVLGVAAAKENGVGIVGVADGCMFLVSKSTIPGDVTSSFALSHTIMHVIKVWMVDIISLSWDIRSPIATIEDAVDTAFNRGVLIVGGAGNEDSALVNAPALYAFYGTHPGHENGYSNVISAGGIRSNDKPYGAFSDISLNRKIGVVAPAYKIFTAHPRYRDPFKDFNFRTGTSFSAPFVAGICGLLLSQDSTLQPDQVRNIIETTADKIWQDPLNVNAYDTLYIYDNWHSKRGYGRVNAYRAVTLKTLKAPLLDSAKVVRDAQDTTSWIKLFWRDISLDEDSFWIYRTVIDTPYNFSKVASTKKDSITYKDHRNNLVGSETYIYRVRTYENISKSGNFSDSAKVKNIPNKPVQKTPLVITNISQCCPRLAPINCDYRTNKVIVRWDKPTNQKNILTKYKIKVKRGGGTVFWFTHNDVSQDTLRDTLCLWSSYTCSLWVYAYDATDSSNTSNAKVVVVGPCQVCTPPLDFKITPPFEVSEAVEQPKEFSLSQNYPNPFNPTTQISYALPQEAEVEITIYNILGRKVRSFNLGQQTAGYRSVFWDGKDNSGNEISSGIYFYRIVAGDFSQTKKMTLLK